MNPKRTILTLREGKVTPNILLGVGGHVMNDLKGIGETRTKTQDE